jgi:hypothetical protein
VTADDMAPSDVEKVLLGWVEESLELRHGAAGDPDGPITAVSYEEGPEAVQRMLFRVRQRADRLEFIFAKVTQFRAAARRRFEQLKYDADLRYDQATSSNAAARVREYVTKEERHAEAALASLAEKREQHLASRLVSVADESFEVVRQIDYQLTRIRGELRDSLRAFNFESNLER